MGIDPTYEQYRSEYMRGADGGLDEDSFARALPEASARVRVRCACRNLDAMSERDSAAYRRAVCAACEAVDSPAAVSYSAGRASETFADGDSMGVDAAIERELAGTPLCCTWV